jgi:hypothetical protein
LLADGTRDDKAMKTSEVLQLVAAATPLIFWLLNVFLLRRLHWLLLFGIAWITCYAVLMTAVAAVETELERELYRFDLNADGSFSENELTPEAERAFDAVTADTGRTFAPITGVPITCVWTMICFAVIAPVDWTARSIRRRISTRRKGDLREM